MFRLRTSSQKPADDLLAEFRQQFPEVSTANSEPPPAAISQAISQATVTPDNPTINATAPERIQHPATQAFQDLDPTPRASNDPWRFTPSLLDPGAFGFHNFVPNAAPAYYPPTPGGMGGLIPPQTSALAMTTGLESPISIPTTTDVVQQGLENPDLATFQALEPNQLHPFTAFGVHDIPGIMPPAIPLVESNFVHHDTGYETMKHHVGSPMESEPSRERIPPGAAALLLQPVTGVPATSPLPPAAEKFRFLSALNAPTAMVKHSDEIPVTYLNKGQVYSLSIVDTNGPHPAAPGTRYRTYVRVSFEDEQQRQKPAFCWSLWKEGRGTNEAHQRGGKLQAVEYVESSQPIEGGDKRTRVELESSSFDGFAVTWTTGASGAAELNLALRFNFLSTDFSHSKGVKGIPVRLCAKTQLVSLDAAEGGGDPAPEICYCKVKLFRDHGAERKLSNDVAHVKKSVEKLKQHIEQAENGHKDSKRKRSNGIVKVGDGQRVAKTHKHKRTWSLSSASSTSGGPRPSLEDDMHFKLQSLQDMFTSTRPISVLYLRGDEQDDPDLHPVSLSGDCLAIREFLPDGANWQSRSTRGSVADSLVSPSPSSLSLTSHASAIGLNAQWQSSDSVAQSQGEGHAKSEQPTTVGKTEDDGTLSSWIEALGVDPSYQPPTESCAKPAACFYLLHRGDTSQGGSANCEFYRAIYLSKRTLADLNERIAAKWGLDASRIMHTRRTSKSGLEIEVDDDMVQAINEGQDMELQILQVPEQPIIKEEWEMVVDGDEDKGAAWSPPLGPRRSSTPGLVLKLIF